MNKYHFEIESIRKTIDLSKYYTIEEVAKLLKVHYITVYRLIQFGELDAVKVGGVWRVPGPALLFFLESKHPFNLPER
jgi:excisionase family DNA binding protein